VKQVEQVQLSPAESKQAQNRVEAFKQNVATAQENVFEAQRDAIFERYRWGASIVEDINSLPEQVAPTAYVKEIEKRFNHSDSYVWQHIAFARKCNEEYPGYKPPAAGYIAWCQDTERKLTWGNAYGWSKDTQDASKGDTDEDTHRTVKEVERALERLDDASEDLSEQYLDRKDEMTQDERKKVEGVITRAQQAIQDEKHLLDTLPDEAPERVECDAYRRFVKDHASCVTGVMGETIVPHHPKGMLEGSSGVASKYSDFYCVPLTHEEHVELENMDEKKFWRKHDTDPIKVAAELQNEWNSKLVSHE